MSDVSRGRTVAISRQRGSGGSYIGRAVAERLGLRYFDREMLRTAAEYLRAHKGRSSGFAESDDWFERFGAFLSLGCLDGGYVPPSPAVMYEGEIVDLENDIIRDIADEHLAVIVGRGAAQTLRDRPSVFTVFLHAPEKWRVDRVRQLYTVDNRAALQMVQESDRDRANFVTAAAGIDWTDARYYDLAINTATVGFEAAIDSIVRAAPLEAVG